ncbi:MAG: hypothetical protein JWO09_2817 [Bacteroidetes bacterium]|nr:hypothetical protein [Bacteroidota bacterium]
MKLEAQTTWYNELGSQMQIQIDPTTGNITGQYTTNVGTGSGQYALVGQVDLVGSQNSNAIGFVVVWTNGTGSSEAVTTWSGQLINNGTILTTWLLTAETALPDTWKSTLVGQDVFTQNQPSKAEIDLRVKAGHNFSHPASK